jgi:hypothetical protein
MPSLLLVVFALQFLLHIINTVGANTVNELVSPAPTRCPHVHQANIAAAVMATLQQAPYADLRLGPEGSEAQEGDRRAEA